MPILRSITLDRKGTIRVRVAGDRHCGDISVVSEDGEVRVEYTIHLVVDANGLDSAGFLVDQGKLHETMRNIGQDPVAWREPCELLSVLWGYRLLDWITTTNTQCTVRELTLQLSPAPHGGSFTATFTNPVVGAERHLSLRAAA